MKTKAILFSVALLVFFSERSFASTNDTIIVETKTTVKIDTQTGDTISIVTETNEPQNIEADNSYIIDENNNQLTFFWQTKKNKRGLDPHWEGFSFLFNGYDEDKVPLGGYKASSSYTYSFNISSYSMRLFNSNFGLFTGLGLDFSRYSFQDNAALAMVNGTTAFVPAPDGVDYRSSVLSANYVSFPLMLEYQFKNFYVSGGAVGLIKFYSKSRVKYRDLNGDKQDEVMGRDMNLRPVDFRMRFQVGIGCASFVASYAPMSIFRDKKGPEMKPFSMGILLSM